MRTYTEHWKLYESITRNGRTHLRWLRKCNTIKINTFTVIECEPDDGQIKPNVMNGVMTVVV